MASNTLEITHHHTKNDYDMFSDHIPIEFQVKIEYIKRTIKNELTTL